MQAILFISRDFK